MPKTILTDISVRSFSSPERGQVTYWDEKLPGFGCRVSQGGQKTFVVMYGPRDARRRKMIGKYPLQTLKEARDAARKVLASIALGHITKPVKGSVSFDEAKNSFLEDAKLRTKPRTVAGYQRLLDRHFKLGNKKLGDITRSDLQRCLSKLQSVPSEQAHANTAIRIFFNWAYREELIDQNPADRLPKLRRQLSRERVLNEAELREVFSKARQFSWPFGPIIQLCILSGQRRSEIGMLEWDWIDFNDRTITLPGDRVKNGQTHLFPFGNVTAELLERLPEIDQYVFSGRNKNNTVFNGWAKSKRRFDETLDFVSAYTLHDLRRTFSTFHAKLGTPLHVTERLLNHTSGAVSGVAAVYNRHTYLPEMREAVEKYEQKLTTL